jgi:hypothetical protein
MPKFQFSIYPLHMKPRGLKLLNYHKVEKKASNSPIYIF